MKVSIRHWTTGLAVVALALAPALAQRRDGGGMHGRHGPRHGLGFGEHMAVALDLTDEQRSQIRDITQKHMESELGEGMKAMREAHDNLDVVIHDPLATDAQVQQAATAVASQIALVATERHQLAVEIASVLTPEQRKKFAELRQQRGEHRRGSPRSRPDAD